MNQVLNPEYKVTFRIYNILLILLIIHSGLNITRRVFPLPVCELPLLVEFLNFPSLFIFLIVLYFWPIHLSSNQLAPRNSSNTNIKPSQLTKIKNFLAFILSGFFILLMGMVAWIAPETFDSYRLLLVGLFLLTFPCHIYSNLAAKHNHDLNIAILLALPFFIDTFFPQQLFTFRYLTIILIGLSLVIWSLLGLAIWSSNQQNQMTLLNRYNPFARQLIPTNYRRTSLQIIGLSGLAGLIFFTYSYLIVPRIETFGLYKAAFNQVVVLIKTNQLQQDSNKRFIIPCRYSYLSPLGSYSLNVKRENAGLIIKFRIFSLGFGNGSTAFVYRSKPFDCHQSRDCADFQVLGGSWSWERWVYR